MDGIRQTRQDCIHSIDYRVSSPNDRRCDELDSQRRHTVCHESRHISKSRAHIFVTHCTGEVFKELGTA